MLSQYHSLLNYHRLLSFFPFKIDLSGPPFYMETYLQRGASSIVFWWVRATLMVS